MDRGARIRSHDHKHPTTRVIGFICLLVNEWNTFLPYHPTLPPPHLPLHPHSRPSAAFSFDFDRYGFYSVVNEILQERMYVPFFYFSFLLFFFISFKGTSRRNGGINFFLQNYKEDARLSVLCSFFLSFLFFLYLLRRRIKKSKALKNSMLIVGDIFFITNGIVPFSDVFLFAVV